MPANEKGMPDPASSYGREKPKKESPSGRLDLPKPPPQQAPDHLQEQNPEPDVKTPQVRRTESPRDDA